MGVLTAGPGNRATTLRHLDSARDWRRHGRALAVVFLDPDLPTDDELPRQLRAMGIDATVHSDAFRALLAVGADRPDVLVLSSRTPIRDAVRTVTILRAEFALPILLSVGPQEAEPAGPVIFAGARPLLERPYRLESVLAALRELHVQRPDPEPVRIGALLLDPISHAGRFDGRHVDLSPKEFSVLLTLVESAEEVVTQDVLLSRVWPGRTRSAATLATAVARVRHRLADAGARDVIHTARGVGYRLDVAGLNVGR